VNNEKPPKGTFHFSLFTFHFSLPQDDGKNDHAVGAIYFKIRMRAHDVEAVHQVIGNVLFRQKPLIGVDDVVDQYLNRVFHKNRI